MPRKSTLDPQVKALLDNLNLDDGDDELLTAPAEEATQHLRLLYQRLTNGRERALRPGLLAVWKRGLKNRRFPAYGEPTIVMEVLEQPVVDSEHGAGWPYFHEPLDLLLGIVDKDGDFLVYHYDRRRFEPYDGGA